MGLPALILSWFLSSHEPKVLKTRGYRLIIIINRLFHNLQIHKTCWTENIILDILLDSYQSYMDYVLQCYLEILSCDGVVSSSGHKSTYQQSKTWYMQCT